MMENTLKSRRSKQDVVNIQDPPVARALFGSVRWAWIWLIIRLIVSYEWLSAGWSKLHNPAWVGSNRPALYDDGAGGDTTPPAAPTNLRIQ